MKTSAEMIAESVRKGGWWMVRRLALFLTVVMLVTGGVAFGFYAGVTGLFPAATILVTAPPQTLNTVQELSKLQEIINQHFIDPVAPEKLHQGALKGMTQATGDRYAAYYTEGEYKRTIDSFQSNFVGIGVHIELSSQTGLITVLAPIKGSPAHQAGMQAGDAIIEVDGKSLDKVTLDEAVALIRGKEKTNVTLTVKRPGESTPRQFTIQRAKIEVPSEDHQMIDSAAGIGYIRLHDFKSDAGRQVSKAVEDLKKHGMTHLVLDLRGNPGGLLRSAIDVVSLFLENGQPVLHVVNRAGEKSTYKARNDGPRIQVPMVVLVDSFSASAAEIAAGAFKDHGVATLIGTKTFAKGSVQSFFEIGGGDWVKLTTQRYLTPQEHRVDGVGITPDLIVEAPKSEKVSRLGPVSPADDPQLQEAIKHLKSVRQ